MLLSPLKDKYCLSHRHHNCTHDSAESVWDDLRESEGCPRSQAGEESWCPDESKALCYHFC